MYQGEGWLILSPRSDEPVGDTSVSRGGVVDSQLGDELADELAKCIKGRGG